jgi:putative membrane protein
MFCRRSLILTCLLVWYIGLSVVMAQAPADRQFWAMATILPVLFVSVLVGTHRVCPLSVTSYGLITIFLTLHTVGVHYTYAEVPVGQWLDELLHLGRNHFDRIVHFSFGLFFTYPVEELFRLLAQMRGWLLYYLPVMTILGLSGLWEIIESWVAQTMHPELGLAYLGSQGDLWDAQKDMTAALYGSLLSVTLLVIFRTLYKPRS